MQRRETKSFPYRLDVDGPLASLQRRAARDPIDNDDVSLRVTLSASRPADRPRFLVVRASLVAFQSRFLLASLGPRSFLGKVVLGKKNVLTYIGSFRSKRAPVRKNVKDVANEPATVTEHPITALKEEEKFLSSSW